MEFLTDPQLLIAFFTLTALELVLGIDNVIFISILVDKLPPEKRVFARRLGLFLAMFMRLALLAALSWMAGMTEPLVTVLGHGFSGRDLILLAGGAILLLLFNLSLRNGQLLAARRDSEAAMAMKQAMRTFLGMMLRTSEMMTLDRASTKMTAAPMPRPFSALVVTARVGHRPSTMTSVGFSFQTPLKRTSQLLGSALTTCLPRGNSAKSAKSGPSPWQSALQV